MGFEFPPKPLPCFLSGRWRVWLTRRGGFEDEFGGWGSEIDNVGGGVHLVRKCV